MHDLSDKTILVTGASKGIGAAIVRCLGKAGAYVVAHYGADEKGVLDATSDIADSNKLILQSDFSNLDDVEKLWDAAERWRGRVDVLINNAATMQWSGGFDQSLEDWDTAWDTTLQINVLAPARLLRRAAKHFAAGDGGTIVSISSPCTPRSRRGSSVKHRPPHGCLTLISFRSMALVKPTAWSISPWATSMGNLSELD